MCTISSTTAVGLSGNLVKRLHLSNLWSFFFFFLTSGKFRLDQSEKCMKQFSSCKTLLFSWICEGDSTAQNTISLVGLQHWVVSASQACYVHWTFNVKEMENSQCWLTSRPEVAEMMLTTVYSVEMCWLGLAMWRRTLPWTMAPRTKLMWPTTMSVNPLLITLLGPLWLSESKYRTKALRNSVSE